MHATSPSLFSFCVLPSEPRVPEIETGENLDACSAGELRQALRVLERRLGTADERPGDFERARSLAHEINNRAQRDYLRAMLETDPVTQTLVELPLVRRLVA